MERTTGTKKESIDGKNIQVLSEVIGRMMIASRLGAQSYNGDRDLYQALGYKNTLEFVDFYQRYKRQDIAKAIIDRPVKATWQGELLLIESNEADETEFEKQWRILNRNLGLKSRLSRLDKLTGLGRFGALLLGLDDVNSIDSWGTPVKKGARKLLYIRPLGEGSIEIVKFEQNPTKERYGLPLIYVVHATDPTTNASREITVHHSRIIHVTDNPLESDVYGEPRLESVFNRLMDIEKIAGGDAEMFWRGARPGYYGKLDEDYKATDAFKAILKDQFDEFEHNLRRFIVAEGIDVRALEQQIADPSSHMDIQLKLISSETGIPIRILSGSERGELASSEDRSEWLSYIQTRREEHAEPCIVRPFVNKLIEYQILPTPKNNYTVKWSELFAQSEKMRVDIGKARANAIAEYTRNPMAIEIIPPSVFMEKCLGLSEDDVEWVYSVRESEMEEEVKKMSEMQDILKPELFPPRKKKEKSKEQKGEPKKRRAMPSASV
ncbi:MAG: DUF1073 domain-containing protein [Spirochaetota bacterium]|nr:DUF1073 domain-containing protein [Spirochaetota bacterium]